MKIGEEEEQEESRRRRETHWRRQSQSAAGVASAVSNCAACQCGPNACSLAAADLSKSDGLCASVARRDENGERIRVDWFFFCWIERAYYCINLTLRHAEDAAAPRHQSPSTYLNKSLMWLPILKPLIPS